MQSLRIWSELVRLFHLGTSYPSSPSPSDTAALSRRVLNPQTSAESVAIVTKFSTGRNNCRTSFSVTRCWSSVCKRPNSAWTLPSKSSQTMPPSGGTARSEAVVDLSLSWVSSTIPFPTRWLADGNILPYNATMEVLVVEVDLRGKQHWPLLMFSSLHRRPAPGTMSPILMPSWRTVENPMVLDEFNANNLSWFSRTGGSARWDGSHLIVVRTLNCPPPPLPGPALLAGCHPSERAYPPWSYMEHHH